MFQIIFVVETNNNTKSDDRYIDRLIKLRYDFSNNEYKLQYVHMNGKGNFKKRNIKNEIISFQKLNRNGINYVIYCFDTDRIETNPEEYKTLQERKKYCDINGYMFIWFDPNIERVLIKKDVEIKYKKQEALNFYKKNLIIDEKILLHNNYKSGCSNIYLVLDKILKRK